MACRHMAMYGFCGLCYANRKARSNFKGHAGYRRSLNRRELYVMGLHKAVMVHKAGGLPPVPEACRLAQGWPTLWEFLASPVWPDTDPPEARQTGTVTLFTEDGWVKAFINDKAQRLQACVSGATLSEVLTAAEECIEGGGAAWRPLRDKPAGRGRG